MNDPVAGVALLAFAWGGFELLVMYYRDWQLEHAGESLAQACADVEADARRWE